MKAPSKTKTHTSRTLSKKKQSKKFSPPARASTSTANTAAKSLKNPNLGTPQQNLPKNYKKDERKIILLTGVPATGKTTMAKIWCKKYGWQYISLNDLVVDNKLYKKIDKKDGAKIANLLALQKLTNSKIAQSKKSILIDGHLGCEIRLDIDKIIVLRLNPVELTKRLLKRKYSKYKIEQNVKAEVLDYCTLVAEHTYTKDMVTEIDMTDKNQKKALGELKKIIYPSKSKRFIPKIDWSKFLLK